MARARRSPSAPAHLDLAGQPASRDPIDGGVLVVDAARPPGDPARELWRELTAEEKKAAAVRATDAVSFQRVDASLFLRLTRDALLAATDYLELRGKLDEKWGAWRQALRDLPANVEDPAEVDWPKPPGPVSALLQWRGLWPKLDWSPLLDVAASRRARGPRARRS